VFNLEVDAEHVYYVSVDGVLVHNSYSSSADGGLPPLGSTRHIEIPDADNGAYFGMLQNGQVYVGKGPPSRARQSLRRKSREQMSPVDDIAYYPAQNDSEAFLKEAELIEDLGGIGVPGLLNKLNSPGKQ